MKTILKMLAGIWIVPAFGKFYTYGPAEVDNFYDDASYSDDSQSDVTSNIFDSISRIGTAYFQSKTPQTVQRVPLGTQVNPTVKTDSSPWLWLAIFAGIGYVAFTKL